jgi:Pregnancy-associated plasma protein-A/FG-GAP-like repeat
MVRVSCAFDDHHQHLLNTNPAFRQVSQLTSNLNNVVAPPRSWSTGPFFVPVVFHVVYNSDEQNITLEQIDSQIEAMNVDFNLRNADISNVPSVFKGRIGNANITFFRTRRDQEGKPHEGVVRKKTNIVKFSQKAPGRDFVKFNAKGGSDAWDSARFLNLWTCAFELSPTDGELLGFAQFPDLGTAKETDGVAINYKFFGTIGTTAFPGNVFNLGRTVTHEVGHWLGLRHIWGDRPDCSGDDLVADTPPCKTFNSGKIDFPHVTCTNGPNGDMFMNYMDYTNDEVTIMFTKGQVERMTTTLNTSRLSVWSSTFTNLLANRATKFGPNEAKAKFSVVGMNKGSNLDLSAIKMPAKPGEDVEVLLTTASSGYQDISSETIKTDLDPGSCTCTFLNWPGSANDSRSPDLLTINKNGASKSTEVQIYTAASKYQQTVRKDTSTSLTVTDDTWTFLTADFNNDKHPDLIAIHTTNTASKKIEVTVVTGKSDFKESLLSNHKTAIEASDEPMAFLATDWNGDGHLDLIVIRKSTSCHKPTTIEILAGVEQYQEFLVQKTETGLLETSEGFDFGVGDWTGDGRADLIAVNKGDTGSGNVEVLVFAG